MRPYRFTTGVYLNFEASKVEGGAAGLEEFRNLAVRIVEIRVVVTRAALYAYVSIRQHTSAYVSIRVEIRHVVPMAWCCVLQSQYKLLVHETLRY